jgi:3-oxoacyl-[acyl-carrier-protein] synthase II
MLNNIICCLAAIHLDIRGENGVFSPDADAGAEAIAEGVKTLLTEKARAAIVGGVSEKVSPMSLARFQLNHILNTTAQAKEEMCRPFSKHRKGTILGEGCGILVLEPYSSAIERGISAMALISGYGSACEVDESGPGPTPRSIAYAMKEAVRNAELAPEDIDVIIAHGDGLYSGDNNEIEAIHGVFAGVIDRINVFSSKGALGNLLAGSPAVDAVLAVHMLQSGIIPPTLHSAPKESHIRFNIVQKRPLQVYPKRILINSQSCEGRCASLVLESCSD